QRIGAVGARRAGVRADADAARHSAGDDPGPLPHRRLGDEQRHADEPVFRHGARLHAAIPQERRDRDACLVHHPDRDRGLDRVDRLLHGLVLHRRPVRPRLLKQGRAMSAENADSVPALPAATVDAIIADIVELVECESSSHDREGLDSCLAVLTGLVAKRLGEAVETDRHPGGEFGDIVTLTFPGTGSGHVTIVGHYDTVWARGTLAGWGERSYPDEDGRLRLSGPGIFDMKT